MVTNSVWAKSDPYHPLWCHLLDIAAVCEALLPRFYDPRPLPIPRAWLLYLVAMHDVGKADAKFQCKDLELANKLREEGFEVAEDGTGFRHEARSAEWLEYYLEEVGWDKAAARVVAQAIRGHHGNFHAGESSGECYDEDYYKKWQNCWKPVRQELHQMLCEVFDMPPHAQAKFEQASVVGLLLSGLIVLSDWIASNSDVYHYNTLLPVGSPLSPRDYFAAAQVEAQCAVHLLALDVAPSPAPQPPLPFAAVWPDITQLRSSQQALEQACLAGLPPGLLIIEAPMGEGKTEGAIYVAENWSRTAQRSGAYIALPTMATSNQMHGRYCKFLRRQHPSLPKPRLIHGMAWLLNDDSPDSAPEVHDDGTSARFRSADALDWFRNVKRALIAPDGVGTVDQVIMAALNVKHGFLRLFGLSARTLIIDEVHAYDEFMAVRLERLLQWCRALQIPVILLSATLSRRQKERLASAYGCQLPAAPPEGEAYPLLTLAPLDGETRLLPMEAVNAPVNSQRKLLKLYPGALNDLERIAALAVEAVKNGGCACVLANTVRNAQEIFQALRRLVDADTNLQLFHARFRAEQREKIEQTVECLFGKQAGIDAAAPFPVRPRAILVSTQVVEQSLDVDFDVMLSQIAPIDLLLQRSGRLHRHNRLRPPGCEQPALHLLLPDAGQYAKWGGTGYVYAHAPLLRTLALLQGRVAFELPGDFRPLVEGCYSEAALPAPLACEPDFIATLEKAACKWRDETESASSEALGGMIPPPSASVFGLVEQQEAQPLECEEGSRPSRLNAKTRLGDDRRNVLVLHKPRLIRASRNAQAPPRAVLQELFLQKVNLPAWWFAGAEADAGYEPFQEGEGWLRHNLVLPMQDKKWKGVRLPKKGQKGSVVRFTIEDDPLLGITYAEEGKEDRDAD